MVHEGHQCGASRLAGLQHEHANAHPIHWQNYGHHSLHGRRAEVAPALTPESTHPMRLHIDFSTLFEENSPLYSQCFEAGAWFRRGSPSSNEPPVDGVPTCHDGDGHTDDDCWGVCTKKDVITPAGRKMVIDVVSSIVRTEVGKFFSVRPVVGNLTFTIGRSRYEKALRSRGQAAQAPSCASDCKILSNVAVAPSYCTVGVAADAVLSIIKPPSLPGIAGTGSSCASDQNGRPIWLVFAWHSPIDSLAEKSLEENIAAQRGLVLHEILHGLGFSNSFFNYARDSVGHRKNLIKMIDVVDEDGATDEVDPAASCRDTPHRAATRRDVPHRAASCRISRITRYPIRSYRVAPNLTGSHRIEPDPTGSTVSISSHRVASHPMPSSAHPSAYATQ